MNGELSILLVSVGNTRTAVAAAGDGGLARVQRLPNADQGAILDAVRAMVGDDDETLVLVATVNRAVSDPIVARLRREPGIRVERLGEEVAIPVGTCLDPQARTGQDRLLNGAAAYDRFKQACVVIDAGTAVTIDFVDGQGTFHGGAIAPGAQMQLDAMHRFTDALPQVALAAPLPEPFAANTTQAMLHGVVYGIRGAVRHIAERYAEAYGAYPIVVATGGDAHLIFDDDDLVEHIIDDLTLMGMLAAHRYATSGAEAVEE